VIVLAGTFVALGIWQYNRNTEKQDKVKAARAAYAAPAPDLSGASNPPSGARAQASGTLTNKDVLLRDQPRAGRFGTDVLTPMLLADGNVAWVADGAGTLAFYYAACEEQGLPRPNVLVD